MKINFVLKKPRQTFFYTLAWLILIILVRFNFRLSEIFFFSGALLGIYLWEYELEIAKALGQDQTKSLLKNVFTQVALAAAAFYAVTSSTSLFGIGFAIGLFGRSVIEQMTAIKNGQDFLSWFWLVGREIEDRIVKMYLTVMIVLWGLVSLILMTG